MFTVDELLSKRNQKAALQAIQNKTKIDFEKLWTMNHHVIEGRIRKGDYQFDIVRYHEIITNGGKRRKVASFSPTDKYVLRLLSQKLNRYLNPMFSTYSYAYQEGKGVLMAVEQAMAYIKSGDLYVVEIDLKDFFDQIHLNLLEERLNVFITDEKVQRLIHNSFYCEMMQDEKVALKTRGLIQGASTSAVLSNFYLHPVDEYFEQNGYHYLRYADNICVYFQDIIHAEKAYSSFCQLLQDTFKLELNLDKSGVYSVFKRRLLGYVQIPFHLNTDSNTN